MGEKIINWREFDKIRKKLNNSENHLKKVYEAVKELNNTIRMAFESNKNEYKEALRRLNISEREADDFHEKIVLDIMEGELPPSDRQDLLELSKLMDLIADWARDGGRLLDIFKDELDKIPKEFKKGILKMSDTLENEVKVLTLCLELLKKDTRERAIKSTLRVSEIEQLIDQLNLHNLALLKNLKNIGIANMILIRDFINSIEEAADFTKDSSDLIRAIAIKKI